MPGPEGTEKWVVGTGPHCDRELMSRRQLRVVGEMIEDVSVDSRDSVGEH